MPVQDEQNLKKKATDPSELMDLQTSASAFDSLEREFTDVLGGLEGDPSLEQYRVEFEKLFRALKKSHNQEKRLVRKCRELNTEILSNAAKVQAALKISNEDQATISSLREDIDKAWNEVDASRDKEQKATENIEKLHDEVERLSNLVEKADIQYSKQATEISRLSHQKDDLRLQAEQENEKIQSFEAQLREARELNKQQSAENESLKHQVFALTEELGTCNGKLEHERRQRDRLDEELNDEKKKTEGKTKEHIDLQYTIVLSKNKVTQLEQQLHDANAINEKYKIENDHVTNQMQQLNESLEDQKDKIAEAHDDLQKSRQDAKLSQAEQTRILTEKSQLERKFEKEHKTVIYFQQLLEDAKAASNASQNEVQSLKKEIDNFKRREDQARRQLDALEREKNMHLNRIQRTHDEAKKVDEEVMHQVQIVKSLEKDLKSAKDEYTKQLALVRAVEKERDRHIGEAVEQRNACEQLNEENRLRDIQLKESRKTISDLQQSSEEQSKIYDSMRSERNKNSKQLLEAQTEIENLLKKNNDLNLEIKNLRLELASKDSALVKEHFDLRKETTQKEQHKNEISRMKQVIQQNDDIIHRQEASVRRLELEIRKMDEESLMQRKEYDQVINERDILGTQLIRRNDELALLYEKVKIQQSTLRNGEMQYQSRLEDMRLLKLKIKDIQRELSVARGGVVNIDGLTRELMQKQRELLHERTKVKALSEELENPMNVHRWRKLDGSDPATFDMIKKMQLLQRRLIKKTEQVIEKDSILQEQGKKYLEIKKVLARQPGPEVSEQLAVYQSGIKEKSKQMKAMAGELNMHMAQVNEYKFEIERLSSELHDIKRKYFEQKRREALAKEKNFPFGMENQVL